VEGAVGHLPVNGSALDMGHHYLNAIPIKKAITKDGKFVGILYDDGTIVDWNGKLILEKEGLEFVDKLPTDITLSFVDYRMSRTEFWVCAGILILVVVAAAFTGVH
jgi:hypothetical protein